MFWLPWAQDLVMFTGLHAARNAVQIKTNGTMKTEIGITQHISAWFFPVWNSALPAREKATVLSEFCISPML